LVGGESSRVQTTSSAREFRTWSRRQKSGDLRGHSGGVSTRLAPILRRLRCFFRRNKCQATRHGWNRSVGWGS
jgi:hypothetical protein